MHEVSTQTTMPISVAVRRLSNRERPLHGGNPAVHSAAGRGVSWRRSRCILEAARRGASRTQFSTQIQKLAQFWNRKVAG